MDNKNKSDEKEKPGGDGKSEAYPKAIYYILGNEFCERFTFYGIRTIASLYLTQTLAYSETTSTVIFHFFVMIAYFAPILGAIIADSWLGKYKTILYLSVVYAIGNFVLAGGAVPSGLSTMRTISILGFLVVGIGTGGIKPCVAAFGGDQFSHNQGEQRKIFFSIFYFVINFGSTISTLLTPVLRADVQCFGDSTCYPLAFGVPAILMIIAIVLFVAGRRRYIMVPITGNAVIRVVKCIFNALSQKYHSKDKKKEHWLDYAESEYDKSFIDDVKSLLHILWIFLPLPIFWSLFDQTSSRWTLQATRMDGELFGYHIKADQMQAVNPIMILVFIPLFDYVFYPLLKKCNLLTKPLQRITVGGFITAISFVVSGMLEMSLESALPYVPQKGFSEFSVINNSPCEIHINGTISKYTSAFQYDTLGDLPIGKENQWTFKPSNCFTDKSVTKTFTPDGMYNLAVINIQNGQLSVSQIPSIKEKDKHGKARVQFFYATNNMFPALSNATIKLVQDEEHYIPIGNKEETSFGSTDYSPFSPGKYKIYIPTDEKSHEKQPVGEYTFVSGGTYLVMINKDSARNISKFEVFTSVKPNSIHILWQIPQYLIITAGEILLSITGLEFSYSQAPVALKSVVQSAWLFTVAVGNIVVMIVAKLHFFEQQSYEMLLFAVIMAVDMVIFMIMAYFYKYNRELTASQEEMETAGKMKKSNEEETNFNK